jgi:hypothetical protein
VVPMADLENRKSLAPPGFEPRTLKHVASCCTDSAAFFLHDVMYRNLFWITVDRC